MLWPKFISPLPNLSSKLPLAMREAFVSISKWEIFSIPQGHKMSNKLCNYLLSYPWLELQLCKLLKKYIWKRPIFSSVNRTSVFLRELIAAQSGPLNMMVLCNTAKIWSYSLGINPQLLDFSALWLKVFDSETFHHTDFMITARIESNTKNKKKQASRKVYVKCVL